MLILIVASASVFSHEPTAEKKDEPAMFSGLETPAAKTVLAFHKALKTGDAETALSLLAEDVLILEGKGVERSAQQYASHHMISDMKYLKAMTIKPLEHHVTQHNDIAVSISRSSVKGTYKDKSLDRVGNETITLVSQNNEWKIVHIHWSN